MLLVGVSVYVCVSGLGRRRARVVAEWVGRDRSSVAASNELVSAMTYYAVQLGMRRHFIQTISPWQAMLTFRLRLTFLLLQHSAD